MRALRASHAALAAAALLAVYAAVVTLRLGGTGFAQRVDNVGLTLAAALGAVGCYAGARRTDGRARRGWQLIATGVAAWAMGNAVWTAYQFTSPESTPFPSWADAGFTLSPPFIIAGVATFIGAALPATGRLRLLLRAVAASAAVFLISWETVLQPVYSASQEGTFALALGLSYPLWDAAVASFLLFYLGVLRERRRSALLLIAGVFINLLADSAFAYLTALGAFSTPSPFEALWAAGFLLIGLAGMTAANPRSGSHAPGPSTVLQQVGPNLPLVAAILITAGHVAAGKAIDRVEMTAAVVIVASVVAYQSLMLLENARLARELERRAAEREDLVSDLAGRVKEATTLHRIGMLLQAERSTEQVLQDVADALPAAFRRPEQVAARVTCGALDLRSAGWKDADARIEASYRTSAGEGRLVVADRSWPARGGAFLPEEQRFLDTVATMLHAHIERRAAADALKASEARFREMTNAIEEAFFLASPDFRTTLYVSPAFEKVYGVPVDEQLRDASAFLRVVHPDDRGRIVAEMSAVAGEGAPFTTEHRVVRPDGQVRWVQARTYVLRDEHGAITGRAGTAADVTARKAAEDALRRSEERFRALVTHASDPILIADKEGRLTYASPAIEHILGIRPEALIGLLAKDVLPATAAAEVARVHESAVASPAKPESHVLQLPHKQGPPRTVVVTTTNLLDDPAVQGVVVNMRDVTEEEGARESLRVSEERFQQMAGAIEEVFWVASPDFRTIHYVSPGVTKVLGVAREEAMRSPAEFLRWVQPEDRERVAGALTARTMDDASQATEFRISTPDGQLRWVAASTYPIRGEHGELTGRTGTITDITERKRAEESLRASEERFRALVQNAADLILVVDAEGCIRYASPAAETSLGYRPDEVVGRHSSEFIHPEDLPRATEAMASILAGTLPPRTILQVRVLTRDGSLRVHEATGRNQLDNPAVRGVILNLRDVTEVRRAEVRLREAAAREEHLRALEVVDTMRSDFVNAAAHELSTPLTPILLQADLLLGKRWGPLNARQVEGLETIQREAVRLQRLTTLLVASTRAQGPSPAEPLELCDLVRAEVARFGPQAERAGVTLAAELPPPLPIRGHEPALREVLDHLLGNALRFTPRGGRVEVHASAEAGQAVLQVADTGIGFAPGEADRLFQPFGHAETTLAAPPAGPGLGLYIAKLVVTRHGGTVEAASPGPGKGATFTVRIPLALPSPATPAPSASTTF